MISCAWKTRLLLPLAEQGEGLLRNHIRWNWELPLWTSLLLAILAAIWVIAVYARENPVAGKRFRRLLVLLRLAGIGLALVMLAQPVREWYRLTRPGLVVLLDRSASMGTVDAAGLAESSSRMEAWQATLSGEENSLLSRWQQSYQLEVVTFDQQFMRLAASPDELFSKLRFLTLSADSNGGTRLGDAVLYALRELPGPAPAAIVVFSDGVSTGGRPLREAAQIAEGLRVPLFTVAIGREHPPADIGLEDLLVEDIVLPGDRLQVAASLRATGYAGQSAQVTLRQTGRDLILAQTTMELPADGTTQMVRLAMRPEEPGKLELELAVECMPGEVNLENNVLRRSVEVRDDKVRVLLVQSIPSYEYRALKSLLERDPVVELSVVLQEADVDFAQVDQAALRTFPASAAGLYQYDVVLWGDVDPDALPRAVGPLLEQFVVQHGGGSPASPVRSLCHHPIVAIHRWSYCCPSICSRTIRCAGKRMEKNPIGSNLRPWDGRIPVCNWAVPGPNRNLSGGSCRPSCGCWRLIASSRAYRCSQSFRGALIRAVNRDLLCYAITLVRAKFSYMRPTKRGAGAGKPTTGILPVTGVK